MPRSGRTHKRNRGVNRLGPRAVFFLGNYWEQTYVGEVI